MTLEENKKITLGLIEEYSPTSEYLTDDEDIASRINLVYFPNYQYLSQVKPILKTKTITVSETKDERLVSSLPMDLRQFVRIVGLDSNNNPINPEYEIIGKKLYLKQNKGTYIMEYHAFPDTINEETEGTFDLEIDQDAQAILCYMVANDILKVDPSADYTAFLNEYQRRMQDFDTRRTLPSATVEGGF